MRKLLLNWDNLKDYYKQVDRQLGKRFKIKKGTNRSRDKRKRACFRETTASKIRTAVKNGC